MKPNEFEPWRARLAEAFKANPDVEITKFSEEIGKHRDYINRLVIKGTANPDPSLLIRICEKIGVSPAYVISGEEASDKRDRVVRKVLEADDRTLQKIERLIELFDDQ